jgi:hypothetical protein
MKLQVNIQSPIANYYSPNSSIKKLRGLLTLWEQWEKERVIDKSTHPTWAKPLLKEQLEAK